MITRSEAKLCIVELVAAVRVNALFTWAFGHDEEPCALPSCVGQGSQAPQEQTARRRKLRVSEHMANSGVGAHIEATPDEVNAVLQHVRMEELKGRCRGIPLFWPRHCDCAQSRM